VLILAKRSARVAIRPAANRAGNGSLRIDYAIGPGNAAIARGNEHVASIHESGASRLGRVPLGLAGRILERDAARGIDALLHGSCGSDEQPRLRG
jgi:hypothetical protein